MKRFLGLMLTVIMILATFTACGGGGDEPDSTTAGETTDATTVATTAGNTKSDKLYVGYGRANITPKDSNGKVLPVTLAGYPDERVANKIITDLFTSCTAVRDEEGDTVLLFTVDSLHPYANVVDTIRTRISRELRIVPRNVIVVASHCHSAPDINEGANTHAKKYLEDTFYKGFVEAGKAAVADLALCTELYAGTLDGTGYNFIRRYVRDENGQLKHEIEGDHTMPVVRFVREGKKDVIIANWAAHADTVTLQDFYAISADYPYYFTQLAEQKLNAHVSLFNSASGDVNPFSKIESENTVKQTRAYGIKLAEVLINNISSLKKLDIVADVEVSAKTLNLEVDHTFDDKKAQAEEIINLSRSGSSLYAKKCKEYGIEDVNLAVRIATNANRGPTETMPISVVSIGNIVFATAGYEMLTQTSMDIKENSKFDLTFTCGYTGGHNGYIAPAYAFANGAYEVNSCRYVKGTAEKIQAEISILIDSVYTDIFGK